MVRGIGKGVRGRPPTGLPGVQGARRGDWLLPDGPPEIDAMAALRVTTSEFTRFAERCAELASTLAGSSAPTGTGASGLATSHAVRASHAGVEAVVSACVTRVRATAIRMTAAGDAYNAQQAASAAALRALGKAPG